MLAELAMVATLQMAEHPLHPVQPRSDQSATQEIFIVGWRWETEARDVPVEEATATPPIFTIDGRLDQRSIVLMLPLRVERIARARYRQQQGVLYGVRVNGEFVYLNSVDIFLSPSLEEERARYIESRTGPSYGVSNLIAPERNPYRLEEQWAERIARIPICPGDRRCD